MRPGQLTPNSFELAILRFIATKQPSIVESIARLHVLSREFTGVGSFTKFHLEEVASEVPKQHIELDALIKVPSVPNGMGAVLFCKGGKPEVLEVYTFGEDHWDGVHDGFFIEPTEPPVD